MRWHPLLAGLFALTLAAFGASDCARAAEPIYPPGLRIGLTPPAGMTLNPVTHVFEDSDHKARITILDLPLHLYGDMEKMVFAETHQPNVTLLKRESFPFASGLGYYAAVKLTVDGTEYLKWLLLAQSAAAPVPDLAALISIQVPAAAHDVYTDEVARKTLASVTFRPTPVEERIGLLPFKLSDRAGFNVMQVAPVGVVLGEAPGKQAATDTAAHPQIVVTIGNGAPEATEQRAIFARQMLARTSVTDLAVTSAEPIRISNGPGFEIRANAKDPHGNPIALVQWLRFQGGAFLRIVAAGPKSDWDTLFPRFRQLRDGIELR
jgi:hypothetical protein